MQSHILPLALVGIGGALGAIMRFWLSSFVANRIGETFPWGTLVVNVSGAAVIGGIAGWLLGSDPAADTLSFWLFLVLGVLGSYTTVSSFSLQTLILMRGGEWGRAGGNIVASLLLCIGAAAGGYAFGSIAA
jgi:fluoride exporter